MQRRSDVKVDVHNVIHVHSQTSRMYMCVCVCVFCVVCVCGGWVLCTMGMCTCVCGSPFKNCPYSHYYQSSETSLQQPLEV